jgi:glycosyltransferase involved in cell wall biosynthesis
VVILHASPLNWNFLCGHSTVVPEWVAAQNALDHTNAALVVTSKNSGQPPPLSFPIFPRERLLDRGPRIDLPPPFDRPDVVVLHSIYLPAHGTVARKLRRLGIPYIVCPHGGMTHYCQAHNWLKKRIGNLLFVNRLVARAAAVQHLTAGEAAASEGWHRPVFVAGNGVHLPSEADLASPGQAAGLRLVFIGRLHVAYKGLDMLLEACGLLREKLREAGVRVELYGPDCAGNPSSSSGRNFLAAQITQLGLEDVVTLDGPVAGEAKTATLKRADVFLHPSRSEGHPSAVLEALAHGVPCLLTPNTNVADQVVAAGAGWRTDPSPQGIARRLGDILGTERSQLLRAGTHARELARQTFNWQYAAGVAVDAYRRYAA